MKIRDLLENRKRARRKAARKKAAKNIAVGAGVGAAVGLTAGVLLAPKSGKETREELAENVKDVAEKVADSTKKTARRVSVGTKKAAGLLKEKITELKNRKVNEEVEISQDNKDNDQEEAENEVLEN
ncbi:YtxH domain-containing protein [Acetivibrio clariflavus]|uniref:Gas vesicle protein n=1 Tax=Acetivibrio clariflavus (strain DSM 19732 / NBRC 101661 / EBR45) TaxID=720554 RepID=G8LY42_ACECE|nr:YtxH domain-containing protein [Acetivibrio clariflavus]AEV67773.1 gas vesicle protein [Acetivibrio clariflavus DSM 19732]